MLHEEDAVYFSETIVNEITFQEAILMYTVVSFQVRFKSIAKHTAAACVSHLGGRGESVGCIRAVLSNVFCMYYQFSITSQ